MALASSLSAAPLDIGSSLTNITNVINQYVVAPIAAFGIAGYVFNALGESTTRLDNEISDHYAEDNTAIQDQVANRPLRVTLKGYVGELVFNLAGSSPSTLNTLAEKLTGLSSFLPQLSSAATQAQQALSTTSLTSAFNTGLSAASNIYGLVQNVLGAFGQFQNQQNAYTYFKALWQSKTLMGIQTPYEFLSDMMIENVTPVQPENTQWMSEFAVTFKQMRFASTSSTAFTAGTNASATPSGGTTQPATLSGPAAIQGAPVTNLGPIPGAITSLSTTNLISPQLFGPLLH